MPTSCEGTESSWTRIEDPLRVSEADQLHWDDIADVVTVGFGGAGVCAAIEARQGGADVLALDRFAGGGATAYSGGVVYAGGTRYQREAGFEDTAEQMYRYLSMEVGGVIGDETLRAYCESSGNDIDWLASHGVPFSSKAWLHKITYPPEGYYLYYSGNEVIDGYRDHAKPAPRGHRTVAPGFGGYRMFGALQQAARKSGVRVESHTRVMKLILNERGAVMGVEVLAIPESHQAEHQRLYARINPAKPFTTAASQRIVADIDELELCVGKRSRIRARAGVILSTGGFVYNHAVLRRHQPLLADNFTALLPLGGAGCDGSGIELGQSAGGSAELMSSVFTSCHLAPPNVLLEGIAVNNRGQRFINETAYTGFVGNASLDQPEGKVWLVIDRRVFWKAIGEIIGGLRSGLFKLLLAPVMLNIIFGGTRRGRSLQQLAKRCNIDFKALEQTLSHYNKTAEAGSRDQFDKAGKYLHPLKPPFYAINLSVDNKFALKQLFTLGGLRVDENTGEVQGADKKGIEGLYAAGRAAVGLCSKGYLSGMSLGDCVFSGRRAGRHCAEKIKKITEEPGEISA